MPHTISEIKARTLHLEPIRNLLLEQGAAFKGTDHQIDTYYNVPNGRLKWRQGNIENNLIFYNRPEVKGGPKKSHVTLTDMPPGSPIPDLLAEALGVKVVVDKQREIYFIQNVKFHLDTVQVLGHFVEIEAIDMDGSIGQPVLYQQCLHYMQLLGISPSDLIAASYSDMLLMGR